MIQQIEAYFAASPWAAKMVVSVFLGFALIVIRQVIVRAIRRFEHADAEELRARMVLTRNLATACLIFGLFLIWATELRTFAISVVAFAAALVIGTKELLMCVLGAIHRTVSRSFQLGDRIEVGAIRGDVIDLSLLGTTVLEVGPGQGSHQFTGRAVTIPNSVFLNQPVVNESYTEDYVLHTASVHVPVDADWRTAETALLESAGEHVAAHQEVATKYLHEIAEVRGLPKASTEPRVVMEFDKASELTLMVRFVAPSRTKGRVEQSILRGFLERTQLAENTEAAVEGDDS